MAGNLKMESGIQLLARLMKRPVIENFYPLIFQTGPANGDIIEISSDTCTSNFLVDITSELLINHNTLNETPAEVLIFDTDGNFNYNELINTVKRKIWNTMSSTHKMIPESFETNKEVYRAMARLHISNIYDATQFYTTIYNLENTLVEHPNISIIIFYTLTAFYWSEQGFKMTKMDLYTKNLINIIQKVTKDYRIISMYTRPEYFCSMKESESLHTEIKYQIQLLDNDKGHYQVNIKTSHTKLTKFFRVVDNELKWLL